MPEMDFADVKPGVLSFLTIGVSALLFIVLLKAFTARYSWVPQGLKDLANAA
jgi:hypothetical protein